MEMGNRGCRSFGAQTAKRTRRAASQWAITNIISIVEATRLCAWLTVTRTQLSLERPQRGVDNSARVGARSDAPSDLSRLAPVDTPSAGAWRISSEERSRRWTAQ